MPELDLKSAPLGALLTEQALITAAELDTKLRKAALREELSRRFAASGIQALAQQNKEHGTTTLELQDRFKVKVERKQEVKWDSAALMAVAQTLPWERVRQLFKIDFSMSETIYKGIAAAAPELREKIDAARTTTLKEPTATLIREEPLA